MKLILVKLLCSLVFSVISGIMLIVTFEYRRYNLTADDIVQEMANYVIIDIITLDGSQMFTFMAEDEVNVIGYEAALIINRFRHLWSFSTSRTSNARLMGGINHFSVAIKDNGQMIYEVVRPDPREPTRRLSLVALFSAQCGILFYGALRQVITKYQVFIHWMKGIS